MRLGHEKAKRRALARPAYDPIASFKPPFAHKRKKHFRPHKAKAQSFKPAKLAPSADCERVLTLFPDSPKLVLSRWRRTAGIWKCITADPQIEWFLRASVESVESHLLRSHFPYMWQRATPVCTAHNPQTEDNPAERHHASAPPGDNTVASLNNNTPDALRGPIPQATAGLEQDGLTIPHCLIATDCTAEPETSAPRC